MGSSGANPKRCCCALGGGHCEVGRRDITARSASLADLDGFPIDENFGTLSGRRAGGRPQVGHRVRVRSDDARWHLATVQKDNSDGTFTLRYEEGGVEVRCDAGAIRKVKSGNWTPVNELRVDQPLPGKVTRVVSYGAFVDVGAEWDGLLPQSKMLDGMLRTGESVQVWVHRIREDGALELAMKANEGGSQHFSVVQPFADLRVGQKLSGRVTRIMQYGAFVDVGVERAGLVPLSKMPEGVRPALRVGSEVNVWVSQIRDGGVLELSMVQKQAPMLAVRELFVGQKVVGTVSNVVAYGVFVDIGAERDGLVPLSKIGDNAANVPGFRGEMRRGQRIEVSVHRIRDDGALELAIAPEARGTDESSTLEGFSREVPDAPTQKEIASLEVGTEVRAQWQDGDWYMATVQVDHGDGMYTVRWDEYDDVETRVDATRLRVVKPGVPVNQLQVGQWLTGKVVRVVSYGAFVDVGAEWDGLVPLSKMVEDGEAIDIDAKAIVQAGQEVDVWVSRIRKDGALELTMIESKAGVAKKRRPPQDVSSFMDISDKQWFPGVVTWVHATGAFVRVKPPRGSGKACEGMVHISELSSAFVQDPHTEVAVGEEVQVRVIGLDHDLGRMKLSMRDAAAFDLEENVDFSQGADESYVVAHTPASQ